MRCDAPLHHSNPKPPTAAEPQSNPSSPLPQFLSEVAPESRASAVHADRISAASWVLCGRTGPRGGGRPAAAASGAKGLAVDVTDGTPRGKGSG